jgi:hypothetical protein
MLYNHLCRQVATREEQNGCSPSNRGIVCGIIAATLFVGMASAEENEPVAVLQCRGAYRAQQHRQPAGGFISLRGRHSTAHQFPKSLKFAARCSSGSHFDGVVKLDSLLPNRCQCCASTLDTPSRSGDGWLAQELI